MHAKYEADYYIEDLLGMKLYTLNTLILRIHKNPIHFTIMYTVHD